MLKPIVALVAPSKAGKTTLILEAIPRVRSRFDIVKSVTTRAHREPSDQQFYDIVSYSEFLRLERNERLIQFVEYAGERYGNIRETTDRLLLRSIGIMAMTEDAVRSFRKKGYRVIVVRVIPIGGQTTNDPRRLDDDRARVLLPLFADLVIENNFAPGGKEFSVKRLVTFLNTVI